MTELAYLADGPAGYVRSFRARITALPPGGVVLDRTYFYPGGGGQPPDRGGLRVAGVEFSVVDVARSGPAVVHRLRRGRTGGSALAIGAEVEGTLDWDRRYGHMRLHTGQHLLSALVFARTGRRTAAARLQGRSASIVLEGPLPAGEEAALARAFEEAVARARPVTIRHVPRSEWESRPSAPRSGLVPLAPHVDPVRIVEIEAEDACPCGGTHLASTGEIGPIRLEVGDGDVARTRLGFTLVGPGDAAPPV